MGRIALPAIVAPPQESGLGHLNGIAAIDDFIARKSIVRERHSESRSGKKANLVQEMLRLGNKPYAPSGARPNIP
jgi:hypothetical protein